MLANCSAAAWLQSPESGGNIESIVVFDHCSMSDFSGSAHIFSAPHLFLTSVPGLGHAPILQPISSAANLRLTEVVLSRFSGELQATTNQPIGSGARVELEIAGERILLRSTDSTRTRWSGPLPSERVLGLCSHVC